MVTKRTGQLLHLDPDKVALLNELSAETRVPKSVLMREAIDDLLAKHGKESSSETYDTLRRALKKARSIVVRFRKEVRGIVPQRQADEAREAIDAALEVIGSETKSL